MLITRCFLRCARALSRSGRFLLSTPAGQQHRATFRSFATVPARHDDVDGKTPATRQLNTGADVEADPYANEDRVEVYVCQNNGRSEMTVARVSERRLGRQSSVLYPWRVPQARCI